MQKNYHFWSEMSLRRRFGDQNLASLPYIVLFFYKDDLPSRFFYLTPSATIGSRGDFSGRWSMYFFMANPLFAVLKVFEHVIHWFRVSKCINISSRATPPSFSLLGSRTRSVLHSRVSERSWVEEDC